MWQRLRKDESVLRRVVLLKSLLIAADAAASALTPDGKNPPEWIRPALAKRIDPSELDPVIAEGLDKKPARDFQIRVGVSESSVTVVIAGCGNGKTTAAYMWAKKHAAGRKLFFTYPTTGTASAGFEDYLFDQKKLASELIHGRAGVDLQAMRGTGEPESDDAVRIDSLRAWDRQAVVCTVDTVLGLLQNQRRPLYSFPAIAAGAFVCAEIHSYDARLFGGLLRFLKTFPGLPVLLMSASIPPARMNALGEALGARMGDVIRGDPVIEGYKRYRLRKRDSAEACRDEVTKALRANKKVLSVCNTVADAIKLAREAGEWAGVEPLIFHSRFRYRDRVNRQKQLIARFKAGASVLAITTQVCEMSLDISADLMVTAECPLPSLVQRLGRLNRYATKDDPWPCLVYPFKGMPYNEEPAFIQPRGDCIASMKACRAVVAELDGKACSQRDLAERLDRMDEAERFEEYSAWLDDGWLTEPAQVRDGDASITLIREEDLSEIEREVGPRKKWTHGKLVPWTIPMLLRSTHGWDRWGGYPVAPAGTVRYCEKEGAEWAPTSNR
jgi:CRISPR-associated endonuclease/helicase Cas3